MPPEWCLLVHGTKDANHKEHKCIILFKIQNSPTNNKNEKNDSRGNVNMMKHTSTINTTELKKKNETFFFNPMEKTQKRNFKSIHVLVEKAACFNNLFSPEKAITTRSKYEIVK